MLNIEKGYPLSGVPTEIEQMDAIAAVASKHGYKRAVRLKGRKIWRIEGAPKPYPRTFNIKDSEFLFIWACNGKENALEWLDTYLTNLRLL